MRKRNKPVDSGTMEEKRRLVKSMAAFGMNEEDIAKVLGMKSSATLRKRFQKELDYGPLEANGRVAQTLFHMATVGRSTAAGAFWLKTRAGWRERPNEIPEPPRELDVVIKFVKANPAAYEDEPDGQEERNLGRKD